MKNSAIVKACDALWQQCICLEGKCRLCCSTRVQIFGHHNIPRASMFYRHDVRNGTPLCLYCHTVDRLAPHVSPKEYRAWLARWFPEQYAWVQANKNEIHKAPDLDDLKATRKRLRDFLEAGRPYRWDSE